MASRYEPIACSLHDELQLRALRGRPVAIDWREGEGVRGTVDRIVDVFPRDGVEYLRTAGGEQIRLDRLVLVDGITFGPGC